jgi:hypothetical protein
MTSNIVKDYLDYFSTPEALEKRKEWPRVECCGTSRSLYCSECYNLLIPPGEWLAISATIRKLPFRLHIILHDRRNVATGLHAKVLDENLHGDAKAIPSKPRNDVHVFDLERLDPLPANYPEHTYLLFPSEDSIPLESVRHQVKTLVVLDCKWTKSSSRNDPRLGKLPRVHLTNPSTASYYWRWHSAGPGCLSTMEAIYEALCEVEPEINWLPWLWLFALQHAAAGGVSHEQKLLQQEIRRKKGTEKHLQDKEKGKILSQRHKRDGESGQVTKQQRKPQWQIHLERERHDIRQHS